ncbi:pentapeptide repeat-containing protein [Naasia lichenicola]|uniref:Pentapeptide repeat-containing protein n=1 Tax=Naasia lichenicola TaxID=2565933 RepID=A0A4S4FHZ1_9MICO|nr:pentapeptide repeat-containing protein [Naasia lichenicola]THG28765.1 pentapeptide repeat-containing protein [Naasia lichenicola]
MASRTRVELGRRADLGADCANCVGLCCVALAFARTSGFPYDKAAGDPCRHLDVGNACRIHESLDDRGLVGCTSFDCFGAGQKVTQQTFGGRSWREDPLVRTQMFTVFPIVRRLHELLWHLDQALGMRPPAQLAGALENLFSRVLQLADSAPESLAELDVDREFDTARPLLIEASRLVRRQATAPARGRSKRIRPGADLMGVDLHGADLRGADLRGALLIAADLRDADLALCDLLGADLRDADVRGARLADALFLTQMQVNGARGDERTTLPDGFLRPSRWSRSAQG